jgi:hypothetical protein
MTKQKKTLTTRNRAIVSSIVIGISFFLLLSPVVSSVLSFIFPPVSPRNVVVIQKSREVDMAWDNRNVDIDVVGFKIEVEGQEFSTDSDSDSYIISNLENDKTYEINFYSVDNLGRNSSPITFSVTTSNRTNSYEFNAFSETEYNQRIVIFATIVIAVLTFVLTQWILFFKLKGRGFLTIGFYPSVSLAPFLLLASSLYFSINSSVNKSIYIALVAIGISILSYLIFLTTNILNISLRQSIPLEQAARASQFIISLISSYIIFIYSLSSNYGLGIKLAIIVPFIFYFTYAGIWILKNISNKQVLDRTIVITLVMVFAIVIILVWPINVIYSILAASVIYYILLNIALDYRTKLNLNYWIEYIVLIVLVSILLITTATWGINGSIV